MSLSDVLEIERARVRRLNAVRETVYERMKNRVSATAKIGYKSCIYMIPEFIVGYPLVNVEDAMAFLCDRLTREGFIPAPLNETCLFITWDLEAAAAVQAAQAAQAAQVARTTREKNAPLGKKMKERFDDDLLIESLVSARRS